ncbi:MAG: hypothetical protein ACR2OU_21580 [Thermomicrobiales bacterium]
MSALPVTGGCPNLIQISRCLATIITILLMVGHTVRQDNQR